MSFKNQNIYFQLFKVLPEINFINKIANLYGIKDLDTCYKFSLKDLTKLEITNKIDKMKDELKEYYLNCKYKKYTENLTEKKSITILRHFLKVINYKVISKEKYSDNKKYLIYNIKNNNLISKDYKLTMNFE